MSSGDQFKPITKPYLKRWRERLDGERLTASIAAQQRKRADKELDKVVEKIKKRPPHTKTGAVDK